MQVTVFVTITLFLSVTHVVFMIDSYSRSVNAHLQCPKHILWTLLLTFTNSPTFKNLPETTCNVLTLANHAC